MKLKQVTLPSSEKTRIRIITWEDGELPSTEISREDVPDLHFFDTPQVKALRDYRIKQVMDDGKESPWVSQKKFILSPGLNQTYSMRVRAVGQSSLKSIWQTITVQTGSKPGEPGEELMKYFIEEVFKLVLDAFVDKVQLELQQEDSLSVNAQDEGLNFNLFAKWAEYVPLDKLTELVRIVPDLFKLRLVEILEFGLTAPLLISNSYQIKNDKAYINAVTENLYLLFEQLVKDTASGVKFSSVTAWLDNLSDSSVHSFLDYVLTDMHEVWIDYITHDSNVVAVLDRIRWDIEKNFIDKVTLDLSAETALISLLKEIFTEDLVNIDIQESNLWALRYQLSSAAFLAIAEEEMDMLLDLLLTSKVRDPKPVPVQVTTTDQESWLKDYSTAKKFTDFVKLSLEVSRHSYSVLSVQDEVLWAFILAFTDIVQDLAISESVQARLLSIVVPSIEEVLELSVSDAMRYFADYGLRDSVLQNPKASNIDEFGLSFDEKIKLSLRDLRLEYAFGNNYGADLDAFIMGKFILGVTPLGRR